MKIAFGVAPKTNKSPAEYRAFAEVIDRYAFGNPAMVSVIGRAIRVGAVRASRSQDAVGICLGVRTVIDADRDAARSLQRDELALYLPLTAGLDPETEIRHTAGIQPEGRAASPTALRARAFAYTRCGRRFHCSRRSNARRIPTVG